MNKNQSLLLVAVGLGAVACSSGSTVARSSGAHDATTDASQATHSGLISIQDMAILGAPPADHGLTVQVTFNPVLAPDYEELPGQLTGCKAWLYDVTTKPTPRPSDQGTLTFEGLSGGAVSCRFENGAGYQCPTASGSGSTAVTLGVTGKAEYSIAGAGFSDADVGRYLEVKASGGKNGGSFPIVAARSETTVLVVNPSAEAREFAAEFRVLAGAGPVPDNPRDPIAAADRVTLRLAPGGERAFDFPELGPIAPGGEFVLDVASRQLLAQFPLEQRALTLSCAGTGGSCTPAQATVVRISSSDGDTSGAPPSAMPPPLRQQIEIQCGLLGGDGSLTVPAEAMALLADGHRSSPITRLRIAFMREGLGIGVNASGSPNAVRALVGHGVLAFVNP